jgi:uncharacterized membrane protein YkoI
MTRVTLAVLPLATVLFASATPARANVTCYPDWSTASAVARSEGLTSADRIVRQAPTELGGDVARMTLCKDGTSYVYRLVVRDAYGQVRSVTVDARRPFSR